MEIFASFRIRRVNNTLIKCPCGNFICRTNVLEVFNLNEEIKEKLIDNIIDSLADVTWVITSVERNPLIYHIHRNIFSNQYVSCLCGIELDLHSNMFNTEAIFTKNVRGIFSKCFFCANCLNAVDRDEVSAIRQLPFYIRYTSENNFTFVRYD